MIRKRFRIRKKQISNKHRNTKLYENKEKKRPKDRENSTLGVLRIGRGHRSADERGVMAERRRVTAKAGRSNSEAHDDEVKHKERRVDAWALRAEEGRDKLRKAAGRSKYPENRGCPNGETRHHRLMADIHKSIVYAGEPGELKPLSSRRKREQQ